MGRVRELVSARVALEGRDVRWWVGATPAGLQVVLVDAEAYEGASSDIALAIKEELDNHLEGINKYYFLEFSNNNDYHSLLYSITRLVVRITIQVQVHCR